MLARATRDRVVDGEVVLGPNRQAVEQAERPGCEHEAVVLASGGLGLISFPGPEHRLFLDEIEAMHPGLIQALTGHPGIGFVMVRTQSEGRLRSAIRGAGD